jgi:ArsR family transcriptional regulator, lead/cadmium/zinc/bismuth-responsive transcriptional repressor
MHLLSAERSGHRVIDSERVCQAVEALASPQEIGDRARRFAILGDPTRLTLLTCIKAAGPISVSDLAAATGINDTTVSQTLRYLRATQTVTAERDGRIIRYRLAPGPVAAILACSHGIAGLPAGRDDLRSRWRASLAGERSHAVSSR